VKGLTPAERSALQPVGPVGEWAAAETLEALIADGRSGWEQDPVDGEFYFAPTSLGLLALRVCPVE